jgi:serine O-acetyltransferase
MEKYRLGFSIPENIADEGLQLQHYVTIVINANARLGKHCRLHVCINIGVSGGSKLALGLETLYTWLPARKFSGKSKLLTELPMQQSISLS